MGLVSTIWVALTWRVQINQNYHHYPWYKEVLEWQGSYLTPDSSYRNKQYLLQKIACFYFPKCLPVYAPIYLQDRLWEVDESLLFYHQEANISKKKKKKPNIFIMQKCLLKCTWCSLLFDSIMLYKSGQDTLYAQKNSFRKRTHCMQTTQRTELLTFLFSSGNIHWMLPWGIHCAWPHTWGIWEVNKMFPAVPQGRWGLLSVCSVQGTDAIEVLHEP